MKPLHSILDRLGHPRILVLGDLILDRYTWGNAERVSPEAPVLVLRTDLKEVRLGGAASVAGLLRALEAEVLLAGVTGDDAEGRTLRKLLRESDIDAESVLIDSERPTTVKERFVGRAAGKHPHQILRVDSEEQTPLRLKLEEQLTESVVSRIAEVDAVLVSDYAKGVCKPTLLSAVMRAAERLAVPVLVDPARILDYSRYRGAPLLKANRIEAGLAVGLTIDTPADALQVGGHLCHQLKLQAAVITLDKDGMVLVTANGSGEHFPVSSQTIYDITGAGDMALAAMGVGMASHLELRDCVQLANLASGLEVARLGVTPITREELRQASQSEQAKSMKGTKSFVDSEFKIVSREKLAELADRYREAGRRMVFTNGCFDLLHAGHLTCLEEAAVLGDLLIVAINSDAGVRRLKGPNRPIVSARDRARLLAGMACVDHVVIFDEETPESLLEIIRPQVLVKGGTTHEIVGREQAEAQGAVVTRVRELAGRSTSSLLQRIQSTAEAISGS